MYRVHSGSNIITSMSISDSS